MARGQGGEHGTGGPPVTIRCPACLDTGAVTTPDLLLDACPLCAERANAEWEARDLLIPPRPGRPPPRFPGGISNVVHFVRKAG